VETEVIQAEQEHLSVLQSEVELLREERADLVARLESAEHHREITTAASTQEVEFLRSKLSEAQEEVEQLRVSLEEARDTARKLHVHSEKLVAERDEARNVARALHQRMKPSATD
jgi:hypothetical protein